jgi:lipopolysaccharide transport system ATP-binding protein
MDARILVQARALGKKYPNVSRRRDRITALFGLLRGKNSVPSTSVLSDVNLEIRAGESFALIGENGAGKSTLLKLIVGVLTPSDGEVAVFGKTGALLELGAGFHPDYTGRDNIGLSAALYGLSASETKSKTQAIIDFADIGRYIDEPVKHYSSGMVVRLGFAIIATLKPDLLITDEILAVGDESFQRKCISWLENYVENGGTLLLVSHSMYHVQKLCRHACWLKEGQVVASGDVFDVTQAYLAYQERKISAEKAAQSTTRSHHGQEFYLTDFTVNGDAHDTPLVIDRSADIRLNIRVHSRDNRVPVVGIGFARADGTTVYGVNSEMEGIRPESVGDGLFELQVNFADSTLLPGAYEVRVHALDTEGVRLFDTLTRSLTVRGESREFGLVKLPHVWESVAKPLSSATKSASGIES